MEHTVGVFVIKRNEHILAPTSSPAMLRSLLPYHRRHLHAVSKFPFYHTAVHISQPQKQYPPIPPIETLPYPHQNKRHPNLISVPPCNLQKQFVISALKSVTHKTHFLQIHAHILCTSLLHDPAISRTFLSRVSLRGAFPELTYSRRFFDQITDPSVSHYSIMIRAYSMSCSPEQGLYLYRDMKTRGIFPDPLSSSFAVKSCIKILHLLCGVQIHGSIWKLGQQSDSLLLTTLMGLYSHCEKLGDAWKLFDDMPLRDTVAWNVMISCCIRNNRTRDALSLFDVMQSENHSCEPDDVTCLLLLQACTHLNALEFGERVHNYITEHGYGRYLRLSNSLISMYSRCGCLDKAYEVFKTTDNKNVVSWSAMISGLAMNGYGKQAMEAFEEMQGMGIPPDDQTFTGVLSACSHSGLIDEGMSFLDRMHREFGIIPNIHHYGCIIDLLGRAGLLDQAYQLIISMEIKPDSKIWRTLLGACRIHGHVNLGERVIEHLIELKALEAGDYVLLLNIYSLASNWDKVAEVRKLMKENAIQTTPGCSTIELKRQIHEFIVDDVSHPRKAEIYKMLDEINQQLKIAGYAADLSSELHKLDDSEKGYVLSCHSEKLAVAFGVLVTPPGTKLRVANNLRICADCHKFMKYFSGVYNRDVIMRDRSRFHHFSGGHCSCNDYW